MKIWCATSVRFLTVLLGAMMLADARPAHAQRIQPDPAPTDDRPFELSPLLVTDRSAEGSQDPTGMDGPELARNEPPFSNDFLMQDESDADPAVDATMDVRAAVADVPPVDIAGAVSRVNLKGFPTPRLRNGFTQVGIPEILNASGSELIQGPITAVTGKAAPGGIQNSVTGRPRGKTFSRVDMSANSRRSRSLSAERADTIVPNKLWHRLAVGWAEGSGPQPHAYDRRRYAFGTLVWKVNRAISAMLQADYEERDANASTGVPSYRSSRNEPVIGPYRPLANFSTNGPNAGLRKRTSSVSLQFEGQLSRHLSMRAGVQGYHRSLDDDRWTGGQYLLDTRKFGGTREPQHIEQPLRGLSSQVEATWRFVAARAEHKLTASLENTRTNSLRTQHGLERADRDALPLDVRVFDPDAPNYYRPDYSPSLFRRVITDRRDLVDFTGLVLSERAAFAKGRLVLTAGIRQDFVSIDVNDRKPGAALPHVHDRVHQLSYHFGGNYILVKNRALIFANTSTAFEPSTRIDARTGRVQGNENTLGYEAGAKMLFFDRRVTATAMVFEFANQNISRRNPLYDDPIADPNQTQPQLVAGAEERFTGASIEFRSKVGTDWTMTGRATYTRAITTRSVDLPQEVGRDLTRYPRFNLSLGARYAVPAKKRLTGLSAGLSLSVVSGFVANYESASQQHLEYPGYGLVNLSASYRWKPGKKRYEHSVGFNVRNLLNKDLLALLARPAADRDCGVSYGVTF